MNQYFERGFVRGLLLGMSIGNAVAANVLQLLHQPAWAVIGCCLISAMAGMMWSTMGLSDGND